MKKVKVLFLIAFLLVSFFAFFQNSKAEATVGEAEVYIVCLPDVAGHWRNPQGVMEGVIRAFNPDNEYCDASNIPLIHPKVGTTPPFLRINHEVVSDWNAYRQIVESYTDVIIINTHDEILPVPSGYLKEGWADKIATAMLERQVTWVHVSGYPFYYTWHQGETQKQLWGEAGFQRLMQHINKGDVTIPHLPGSERAWLTTKAEKNLGNPFVAGPSSWDEIYEAKSVALSRPLPKSDFEDYVILPIWSKNEYYEGAVVAFVKPNEKFDPQTRDGFGIYVHIGTGQTFDSANNPTDTDKYCGYVGCAAAVWTATTGFESVARSSRYPAGDVNFTISVTPVITDYSWYDDSDSWEIHIGFFIYGGLKRPTECDIDIDKIGLYVKSEIPPEEAGYSIETYNPISRNAYPDFSKQLIELDAEVSTLMLKTFNFALSFIPEAQFTKVFSGAWLMSDWTRPIEFTDFSQTSKEVNVEFWAENYMEESGYDYETVEFQSIFGVKLTLEKATNPVREGWRIIPLHWGVELFPTIASNYGPITGDNTEMAVFFPREHEDEYTATVFFDDFEEETSLYSRGDLNADSGEDCWGTKDYYYNFEGAPTFPAGKCFWCAAEGYNSIYNEPNIDILYYDKNMDAYLQRIIHLTPFTEALLLYQVTVSVKPGDYLKLYARPLGGDWNWTEVDSITSTVYSEWRQVWLPNTVSSLRFIFHSNDDNQVGLGAIIYYLEIRAHLPNDAYQEIDAGDIKNEATDVDSYIFSGYLDDEDWYNFNITQECTSGEKYRFTVLPPQNAIFHIEVHDEIQKIGGPSDVVELPLSVGIYKARIYSKTGFGRYIFKLEFIEGGGGGGGGGGSCPTLFVWNGTSYLEEGLLDIHAESDVTLHHQIQQSLVKDRRFYKLLLRELDNHTSHIDQVRLYAIDGNGEWHLCPLLFAYHSELGFITWKLRFDDDIRADLAPTEITNLKFMPLFPFNETAYFIFEINGHNRKSHT